MTATRTAALALAAAVILGAWSADAQAARCRAIDGDTLACGTERVRLRGIQAPERGEPGAAEATRRLDGKVRGQRVTLVRHGKDRFGRTRADVYVRGSRIEQRHIGPRGGR